MGHLYSHTQTDTDRHRQTQTDTDRHIYSIHPDHHTLSQHPSNPHQFHSAFSSNTAQSSSFVPTFSPYLPNLHTILVPSLSSVYHSSFVPHVQSSQALSSQSSISQSSLPDIPSHPAYSHH